MGVIVTSQTRKNIIKGARIIRQQWIMIVTFNIFGMPFETKENINKTLDLNAAIEADTAILFIYQIIPATDLVRIAYENNMIPVRPEGRSDICSPLLVIDELPSSYVIEQVDRFRDRFLIPTKYRPFTASCGT